MARAAAALGLTMTLSTVSSFSMEEVAAAGARAEVVPALLAAQPRARSEPDRACRAGRLRGDRAHRRLLPARLEAARSAGRLAALPRRHRDRQLRLRPGVPVDAGASRRTRTRRPPSASSSCSSRTPSSIGTTSRSCARGTELPMLLKGILHPDDARAARDAGSTAWWSPTTAAARWTARSPRSTRCRRWPTRSATTWRCCSTAACARAPTWSRRSRSAPTRCCSAARTCGAGARRRGRRRLRAAGRARRARPHGRPHRPHADRPDRPRAPRPRGRNAGLTAATSTLQGWDRDAQHSRRSSWPAWSRRAVARRPTRPRSRSACRRPQAAATPTATSAADPAQRRAANAGSASVDAAPSAEPPQAKAWLGLQTPHDAYPVIWVRRGHRVAMRTEPGGGELVARLRKRTEFGSPACSGSSSSPATGPV